MKRFFCVVCVICAVFGMNVVPLHAAEPIPYEFFDDFEDYAPNTYPLNWEMISPTEFNRVYVSSDAEYSGGKYAKITAGVQNDVGMKMFMPKLTGKMVFEGDFQNNDYKAKQCPYFYDSKGTIAISIQMVGSFNVYYGDPLRPTQNYGGAAKGEWNHLKLEIDIDKNIYDLYINDVLYASDVKFRNQVSDISSLAFSAGHIGEGMCIDNIKISGTQTLDMVTTEKSEILNNDSKKANEEMWNDIEKLEYQLENPQYTLYSQNKLDLGMAVYSGSKFTIIRNNRFKLDDKNENVIAKTVNGSLMIPAESFAKFMVGEYAYDGDNFSATIKYLTKTVTLEVDSQYITIDAKTVKLKEAPCLFEGKLYATVEDLASFFGMNVFNDGNLWIITDKEQVISDEADSELILKLKRFFETRMNGEPEELAFYVSNNGKNCWSGRIPEQNNVASDGPFRTIERAREAVRAAIDEDMNRDITVYIEEGQYYVDETLTFDNSDGGKNWCYVTYKNYKDGAVTVNGGQAITGWEHYTDKIYRAYVGDMSLEVLSENGEMVTKARYPDAGVERSDNYMAVAHNTLTPYYSFGFDEKDIPKFDDYTDLEVYIWPGGNFGEYNWFTDTLKVTDINYETNEITLGGKARYVMHAPSRYYLRGHLSFLNVPGEYYYDSKTQYLYYYPKNLPIENQVIVSPKVSDVILLKGESGENPMRNLVFDGIGVKNADYKDTGCGFMLTHTANCMIKNCSISSIGYMGILTSGTCMNNIVYGNDVFDVGSHGVYFECGLKMGLTYYQHNNLIENNHIHDTGKLEGHGGGLTVCGTNCVARNNKIDHTGRGALSIGMGTADLPTVASGHVGLYCEGVWLTMANVRQFISGRNSAANFNEVSHANLDSSDMGLFYTWGGGIDVDVKNNYFHDSDIRLQFGYCVYLDDASDLYNIENNVIESMQMVGAGRIDHVMFLKGVGNRAVNNYLVNNPNAARGAIGSLAMGGQQNNSLYLTRNIAYNSGENLHVFENWENNRYTVSENNMFFNPKNPSVAGVTGVEIDGVDDLENWNNATGFDKYTITQDPMFVNSEERDFRLSPESEAYTLGVQDINMQDMGLKADFKYVPEGEIMSRIFLREKGKEENSSSIDLAVSASKSIEVFARTGNGYVCDLSDAEISFSSSAPEVARVDQNGKIVAEKLGCSKITATVKKDGIVKSSDVYVYVGYELEKLISSTEKIVLVEGKTTTILGYPYTADNRFINKAKITYMSDNEQVAEVDEYGIITGKNEGSAKIIIVAEYNNRTKSVSVPVTVSKNGLKYINAKPTGKVFVGRKTRMGQTLYDYTGGVINSTDYTASYESRDENIVTVDKDGMLTGVSEGEAVVSVTVNYQGTEKSYNAMVTVYPREGREKEVIFRDDYEDEKILESYTLSENAEIYEDENTGKRFLRIGVPDKINTVGSSVLKSFRTADGKVGVTAKMLYNGSGIKSGPSLLSADGKSAATIQFRYGQITSYSDSGMIYLESYPVDRWFELTVIADIETKTYEVYLDGVIIGSELLFRNDVDDISQVSYSVGVDTIGVLGVDDLEVFIPEIKP